MPRSAQPAHASRRSASTEVPDPRTRRPLHLLFAFVGTVLVVNAVIGDRGLMATLAAGHAADQLAAEIAALRDENAALREASHRLRTDPAAIETTAREELGLARPGEIVFLLADPPRHRPPAPDAANPRPASGAR